MRSLISAAVLAAALGGAGVADAQIGGQPVRAAYMVEPFTPPSTITIQGTGVRLRNEPFTQDTQILSHGSTGLVLTVVGIARLPDWNWYQVVLKSGQKAFIRSDYTSAPSKGGAPAAAPATQLAAPLPPPSRIDYGAPSTAGTPATVSAPAPLTPQPAPVYTPAPAYTPPAYAPPAASYAPVPAYTPPAPVPPSTPPAGGSAISLVPTSPLPSGAASPNSGGLASDPR